MSTRTGRLDLDSKIRMKKKEIRRKARKKTVKQQNRPWYQIKPETRNKKEKGTTKSECAKEAGNLLPWVPPISSICAVSM